MIAQRKSDKRYGAYHGLPGQRARVRAYPVLTPDGRGECFAWTYWGNERVRWYWVRFPDGREKAYSASQVSNQDSDPATRPEE